MNCFSCSKNIKNNINCDKCDSKFCSDSCLAFHYIFYHNEENNDSKEEDFHNNLFLFTLIIILKIKNHFI